MFPAVRSFISTVPNPVVFVDVKAFISCRRYESLSLHHIIQGFATSECEWLMPRSKQTRVPVTDSLKRRELLEEFVFWYFDSFVIPLLKVSASCISDEHETDVQRRQPFT
jgi:telomerase reverse transcriptase